MDFPPSFVAEFRSREIALDYRLRSSHNRRRKVRSAAGNGRELARVALTEALPAPPSLGAGMK